MGKRKHVYEYEVDLESDAAPARVIRMVKPGSKVLEIGAGPGSITRHLIGTLGCDTVALEVDPSAIELLKTYVPRVYASDLNDPKWTEEIRNENGLFDYVIAADVLEHVYNPWQVLEGMTSLLAEGGAVILSLPHVGHASVAACLLDEDFEYTRTGLLDQTHIRFFGIKNIQQLINEAGLAIEDAQFVVRTPEMTELAARWRQLPLEVQHTLQRNKFSDVYQVVTLSRKSNSVTDGLDLMAITPEPLSDEVAEHWMSVMKNYTSYRTTDTRSPLKLHPEYSRSAYAALEKCITENSILAEKNSELDLENSNLLEQVEKQKEVSTRLKDALLSALRDANTLARDKWWRRTRFLRKGSNALRKLKGKPVKHWPKNFVVENYFNEEYNYTRRTSRPHAPAFDAYNSEIPRVNFNNIDEGFVPYSPTPYFETNPKLIAFYLPQFHPFEENDKWWGKGFTEWTNVGKAKPFFPDHHQPHCPIHVGYYDLRVPEVMEEQARMARSNGISGFAYYFYWFAGKVLMETPLQQMLANPKVDMPFCMIWANENWTRRWDGQENDVLIAQDHSINDSMNLLEYLRPFLEDPRYIKIDGKPLFVIYRADIIPKMKETIEAWRRQAVEFGFPGIYVACAQTFNHKDPSKHGFDAAIEFPPHTAVSEEISSQIELLDPTFSGNIYDYDQVVVNSVKKGDTPYKLFPTAMLSWDNTARKGAKGNIFARFSVTRYAQWLSSNLERVAKNKKLTADERLVFVNAWNEWAEGTHLEPDNKHGFGYLSATRSVMLNYASTATAYNNPIYPSEKNSDVAVIAHVHYEHTWPEIKDAISQISRHKPDTFITVTSIQLADLIAREMPSATIDLVDNRGRDIRPFLHVLKKIEHLDYTAVCKLHGKASTYRNDGDSLRRALLSKLAVEENISRFFSDEKLGMLVPRNSLIQHSDKNLTYSGQLTEDLAERLDIKNWQGYFPAGSMFWFRAAALKSLLSIDVNEFDVERGLADGTLAHAIERLFGSVCLNNGYSVEAID